VVYLASTTLVQLIPKRENRLECFADGLSLVLFANSGSSS
jgi:hypothetical protein